ncbi:hypothetical protein ACWKWU_01645 [Chitinophaga lutea]
MNNPSNREERLLKIFTPVRCLNRDQLLRYLRGGSTPIEKHLVEQHVVDCDLCHEALLSLENPDRREPYERLSQQLSLYLQKEYTAPPAPARVQAPAARPAVSRESLLSYFWVVMFLIIGTGSIFLLQEHLKNRPALASLPIRQPAETVTPPPAQTIAAPVTDVKIMTEVPGTPPLRRDSQRLQSLAGIALDSATLKRKAIRDTARRTTDSNIRVPLRTPAPVLKDTPKPKEKLAAAEPAVIQPDKETPKEAPPARTEEKKQETDKDDETAKSEPPPSPTGAESMYRTGMRYQQQGDVSAAINQFKKLTGNDQYSERAKYQLGLLYRSKGQNGKARRLFREIIRMDGNLKTQAQTELDNMN